MQGSLVENGCWLGTRKEGNAPELPSEKSVASKKKGMVMSTTFVDFLRSGLSQNPVALHPTKMVSLVRLVWQVRRERNRLASLSRDELAEMGIHPLDAAREAQRGLMDLPKSRLERP